MARAPTDSPISASSAAAWTAVPRTSDRLEGAALRVRGAGGAPAGCAGWRRRGGLGLAAVGLAALGLTVLGLAVLGLAVLGLAALGFGGAGWGEADEAARVVGLSRRADAVGVGPLTGRGGRFWLLRCGRVRGSEPRTSEGGSPVIEGK
jgi:hypothetical protein